MIISFIFLLIFNKSLSIILPYVDFSIDKNKLFKTYIAKCIQQYKNIIFFNTKNDYWNVILNETTEYTPLPFVLILIIRIYLINQQQYQHYH